METSSFSTASTPSGAETSRLPAPQAPRKNARANSGLWVPMCASLTPIPGRECSPGLLLWALLVLVMSCATAKPAGPPAAVPLRLGVDVHQHVTMRAALPLFSGEPGSGSLASSPGQTMVNQIDVPTLRAAGLRIIVATVWPPPAIRPGRDAMAETTHQLSELREFARRRPDFAVALDAASAAKIAAGGRIALIPGVEGAEAITSPGDVDVLFAAGVRVV